MSGQLEAIKVSEFAASGKLGCVSGQLETVKVSEFAASGQLCLLSGQLESLKGSEFSESGNSKFGELEAGNSKRGTRYLPISQ